MLLDDVSTLDEVRHIRRTDGQRYRPCLLSNDARTMERTAARRRMQEEDVERLRGELRKAFDRGQILDARSRGWQVALADAQTVRWSPASAQLSFQHRRVQGRTSLLA